MDAVLFLTAQPPCPPLLSRLLPTLRGDATFPFPCGGDTERNLLGLPGLEFILGTFRAGDEDREILVREDCRFTGDFGRDPIRSEREGIRVVAEIGIGLVGREWRDTKAHESSRRAKVGDDGISRVPFGPSRLFEDPLRSRPRGSSRSLWCPQGLVCSIWRKRCRSGMGRVMVMEEERLR